jgi:hypothetical protein
MVDALAATLVANVVLPYVKQGGERIAGALADNVGERAADYMADLAGRVWEGIRSRFTSDTDRFALRQFEEHPDDEQKLMERLLTEKLRADPAWAAELERLLDRPGPDGQSGNQIIDSAGAVLLDLRHANLQHAQHFKIVGIEQGPPGKPAEQRPPGEPGREDGD